MMRIIRHHGTLVPLIFLLSLTAASSSSTYSISYDGIVSPKLILDHANPTTSEDDETESSLFALPQSLAEDISTQIAGDILQLYFSLTDPNVNYGSIPREKRTVDKRCYSLPSAGGRKGSRTCSLDHVSDNVILRLTTHFSSQGETTTTLRLDGTMTTIAVDEEDENEAVAAVGASLVVARETLIRSIPKIGSAIKFYSRNGPVWSVQSRPSVMEMEAVWNGYDQKRAAATLDELLLSKFDIKSKMRIDSVNMLMLPSPNETEPKKKKNVNAAEIWHYHHPSLAVPTRALFLNSHLQAITSMSGVAHAEAFVHPAVLAHPNPERILVIGAMPVALVKEILKYRSTVERVVVVGMDLDALHMVRRHMKVLDDCSGFEGGADSCMDDEIVEVVEEEDVQGWLDQAAVDENPEQFDVLLLDIPPFGPNRKNWLSVPFHKRLKKLMNDENDESILVVNAGSTPSMDRDYVNLGPEDEERDQFLRQAPRLTRFGGLEYYVVMVYDEPMAAPLDTSFITLFAGDSDTYPRFVRKIAASIDLDMIHRLAPSTKSPPENLPTLIYDGPAHVSYMQLSRAWEHWYCHTEPGIHLPSCTTFLSSWFDLSKHSSNTEVRIHPIKGRALHTLEDIPKGNFILPEDASTALRLNDEQFTKLEEFVQTFPEASMYKDLYDFVVAYGFHSEAMGSSGWAVATSCNTTFTNHACTEIEENGSSASYVFLGEDDVDDVAFSPVILRRSEILGTIMIAKRDIKAGEEMMQDYLTFRTYMDEDGAMVSFLNNLCETGVGLVKKAEEKEAEEVEEEE